MCLTYGFTWRERCPFPQEIEAYKLFCEIDHGLISPWVGVTTYTIGQSYISEFDLANFEYDDSTIPAVYVAGFHGFLSIPLLSTDTIAEMTKSLIRLHKVNFRNITAIGLQEFKAFGGQRYCVDRITLPSVVATNMVIGERIW